VIRCLSPVVHPILRCFFSFFFYNFRRVDSSFCHKVIVFSFPIRGLSLHIPVFPFPAGTDVAFLWSFQTLSPSSTDVPTSLFLEERPNFSPGRATLTFPSPFLGTWIPDLLPSSLQHGPLETPLFGMSVVCGVSPSFFLRLVTERGTLSFPLALVKGRPSRIHVVSSFFETSSPIVLFLLPF